jgi:hypothetical protein
VRTSYTNLVAFLDRERADYKRKTGRDPWLWTPRIEEIREAAAHLFFGYLIHSQITKPEVERDEGGWNTVTIRDACRACNFFTPGVQGRALKQLERLGLVMRRRHGPRGLRQVWIDFDRLAKLTEKGDDRPRTERKSASDHVRVHRNRSGTVRR